MEISNATVASPMGAWTVEGSDAGVARVYMPHERPLRRSKGVSEVVTAAARELDEYFNSRRTSFSVPLVTDVGTDFQREVWRALQTLAYGEVATYAEVAALAGRPRAARAVGNANHANPWPVIVPCHRVVASNGLGGYGGGKDLKRYLLALEAASSRG